MGNFFRKLFTQKQDFEDFEDFDTFKKIEEEIKQNLEVAEKLEKKYANNPFDVKKIHDLITFYQIILKNDLDDISDYFFNEEEKKLSVNFPKIKTTEEGYIISNERAVDNWLQILTNKYTLERIGEESFVLNRKRTDIIGDEIFVLNNRKKDILGGRRKRKSKAKKVVAPGRHKRTTKKYLNKRK